MPVPGSSMASGTPCHAGTQAPAADCGEKRDQGREADGMFVLSERERSQDANVPFKLSTKSSNTISATDSSNNTAEYLE